MRRSHACFSVPAALGLLVGAPLAQNNDLVSVSSGGVEADFTCERPDLSADGRYVVFDTSADNVVPGDTNSVRDVFRHDTLTGQTIRVSVSSFGAQGDSHSDDASISADGRYVVFSSFAKNLVGDDTNNANDVFLHDCDTGATTLISRSSSGEIGDLWSNEPEMSADARFVTFTSAATHFAPTASGSPEIYLRDLATGSTEHISVDTAGDAPNGYSLQSKPSGDGRFVVFSSFASDLVAGDTNNAQDVFLRDRLSGVTERINVTSSGAQTSGPGANSLGADVSDDGRYVVFWSVAGNIVSGDSNGANDVFLRDRQTGETRCLSVNGLGQTGNSTSAYPTITPDGRYVAFETWANNVLPGDTNNFLDIGLHDLATGSLRILSLDTAGDAANGHSTKPALSDDGRYVTYVSGASDLVPAPTDAWTDVFRSGPILLEPVLDVRVNGNAGPLSIAAGTPVDVTFSLDPGDLAGQSVDWFIWAELPGGALAWYVIPLVWTAFPTPIPLYQGPALTLPPFSVLSGVTTLAPGTYRVHFTLDAPNLLLDGIGYQDTVEFEVF